MVDIYEIYLELHHCNYPSPYHMASTLYIFQSNLEIF